MKGWEGEGRGCQFDPNRKSYPKKPSLIMVKRLLRSVSRLLITMSSLLLELFKVLSLAKVLTPDTAMIKNE